MISVARSAKRESLRLASCTLRLNQSSLSGLAIRGNCLRLLPFAFDLLPSSSVLSPVFSSPLTAVVRVRRSGSVIRCAFNFFPLAFRLLPFA